MVAVEIRQGTLDVTGCSLSRRRREGEEEEEEEAEEEEGGKRLT